MRKIVLIILVLFTVGSYSQEIKSPSEGKSLVYFTRVSSMGFLINFKYFDGEKYLGKFNHGKYLAYECEPGKHLFWAKSENVDYLEAELEAGKVYIVDSEPQMGAFKAGVKLIPFDNNKENYKNIKKYERKKASVLEAISGAKEYTISEDDLNEAKKDQEDLVKRSIEKYNKRKADGEVYTVISVNDNYISNSETGK
ncbi:hypothetical protein [Flavobacterium granuli]|uniref:DUF2846 domain-containing protein n=1 Tax=Flavobacterium granuli TaxID=280093 RepID=A0A1M5JVN1_9FLAO|nr:hypothetical protein [Flavobacterium granuli]PRZ26077.1 hypothetical protein BC624_10236 [Flavobacterium granuli]SHG44621.1 hypothetical protein SAMN05443373_10236 [Flavobacterium granuli]